MFTPETQTTLDLRVERGRAIARLCWGTPSLDHESEDFDSACRDAISDILTARFGPSGYLIEASDGDGFTKATDPDAYVNATSLVESALDSYFGDAEDYVVARVAVKEPERRVAVGDAALGRFPEPGQYGYEESHEDRVVELENFLIELQNGLGFPRAELRAKIGEVLNRG